MDLLVTDDRVSDWCLQHLGAPVAHELFRAGHLSQVHGLQLSDGRDVVVKIRPETPSRIRAVLRVQAWLASTTGFPCPAPLAGPEPLQDLVVHAEQYRPGGTTLTRGAAATTATAQALAQLVASLEQIPATTRQEIIDELAPPPVWAWPQHDHGVIWPFPDDRDQDLNDLSEPAWLNDLGARVRKRLMAAAGPVVIGHVDWEAQNLRWSDADADADADTGSGRPALHAAHDWDSLAAQPEAIIAGLAAAVHTADGEPSTEASVAETRTFLAAYAEARGRRFTTDETEIAWAAGTWVRAFNARKDTLDPGGGATTLARLADEAPERLRRANA